MVRDMRKMTTRATTRCRKPQLTRPRGKATTESSTGDHAGTTAFVIPQMKRPRERPRIDHVPSDHVFSCPFRDRERSQPTACASNHPPAAEHITPTRDVTNPR